MINFYFSLNDFSFWYTCKAVTKKEYRVKHTGNNNSNVKCRAGPSEFLWAGPSESRRAGPSGALKGSADMARWDPDGPALQGPLRDFQAGGNYLEVDCY